MKLFLELLPSFAIAAACMVVIIVAAVRFTRWLERSAPRQSSASPEFRMLHEDEWDLVVDGRVVASLVPCGPPEDLNTSFITFDITVVPGCEAEVESLLQEIQPARAGR